MVYDSPITPLLFSERRGFVFSGSGEKLTAEDIDGTETFILMCSDLTLEPLDIIRAYSYRFKIEVNFKVLKHLMGAFF